MIKLILELACCVICGGPVLAMIIVFFWVNRDCNDSDGVPQE